MGGSVECPRLADNFCLVSNLFDVLGSLDIWFLETVKLIKKKLRLNELTGSARSPKINKQTEKNRKHN
jgi:hypothetical protein